jgi:hypothetical protein
MSTVSSGPVTISTLLRMKIRIWIRENAVDFHETRHERFAAKTDYVCLTYLFRTLNFIIRRRWEFALWVPVVCLNKHSGTVDTIFAWLSKTTYYCGEVCGLWHATLVNRYRQNIFFE